MPERRLGDARTRSKHMAPRLPKQQRRQAAGVFSPVEGGQCPVSNGSSPSNAALCAQMLVEGFGRTRPAR